MRCGDALRAVGVDVEQEDGELVAAQPGQQVAGAVQALAQPVGDQRRAGRRRRGARGCR